jgi:hypothetical protein
MEFKSFSEILDANLNDFVKMPVIHETKYCTVKEMGN